MCGIFCYISKSSESNAKISNEWKACKDLIAARGPDNITERFESLNDNWFAHFAASVLWMQGSNLTIQPAVDSNGNVLLWNGDIFFGNMAQDSKCDTDEVLNTLKSSSNVISVFQEIQGPYSFIYFQKSSNLLYFGRDIIGRHSLLLKLNTDNNVFTLTSVASKQVKGIVELPAIGIFVMNLRNSRMNLACYPWKEPDLRFTDVIESMEMHLNVDIDIRETISESDALTTNIHLHPNIKDLEYFENIPHFDDFHRTLEYLLENQDVRERVDHLSQLLHNAVEVRIKKKPRFCKNCIKLFLNGENITCTHAKVGILFSGGLDSAILSLIADKYVPQNECIDLINVAFEKSPNISRKINTNNESHNEKEYDVPDRKTGKQTFFELLKICPKRKWNLIEVNVSQTELQKYRSSRICDLLYPLCTILDESLGCAVWFASRAKGTITANNDVYESPCRILLLGMGADELFGGYMRHRTILKHKGWDALTEELNIELARISERNLGRDDRIVSDHGKQSRLPYLDENIVQYVQQLKPWERCYPTDKMPSGLGDKLLLRLLACKLGFQNTANFPKRAFQFGSRIANSKENAKNVSERL